MNWNYWIYSLIFLFSIYIYILHKKPLHITSIRLCGSSLPLSGSLELGSWLTTWNDFIRGPKWATADVSLVTPPNSPSHQHFWTSSSSSSGSNLHLPTPTPPPFPPLSHFVPCSFAPFLSRLKTAIEPIEPGLARLETYNCFSCGFRWRCCLKSKLQLHFGGVWRKAGGWLPPQ